MKQRQRGVFLIEALIAILIFSIGILTLVAMQTASIQAQTAAQYRIEAASLADQMTNGIWLNIQRYNSTEARPAGTPVGAVKAASLTDFQHLPTGPKCAFTGAASANQLVTDWVTAATSGAATALPGADATMQQILVDTTAAGFNRVSVTLCWKAPNDTTPHSHTVITYIN
jgi:type IV pilus assembly protein PilV